MKFWAEAPLNLGIVGGKDLNILIKFVLTYFKLYFLLLNINYFSVSFQRGGEKGAFSKFYAKLIKSPPSQSPQVCII